MICGIHHDQLPCGGLELVNRLNRAGYEAWFVGGCVRDLLMGRVPQDWDICTSALPEQTKAVLAGYPVYETGIRHGTVLVRSGGAGYEITTFRRESAYTDHRHPDAVCFVRELSADLARRDFTVNAMAYHSRFGLVDYFGGREDLEQRVIRAVGDPGERFREDALRILRALRFAGRLGFEIAPATAAAIHDRREDLTLIAPERVFCELKGILAAADVRRLMLDFSDVFGVILPETAPLFGYDQNTPHHDADAWLHTARTVEAVPPDPALRLAALLHDTGKPDCCTRDAQGISHFYGHPRRSAELARQALLRLRCDNATREQVERLVRMHDRALPQDLPHTRRFLAKYGMDTARSLLRLRRADVLAQSMFHRERKLEELTEFQSLLNRAEAEGACWSLAQLALKGDDLIALGVPPGPGVGRKLKMALDAVMDGAAVNDKAALLEWLRSKREV